MQQNETKCDSIVQHSRGDGEKGEEAERNKWREPGEYPTHIAEIFFYKGKSGELPEKEGSKRDFDHSADKAAGLLGKADH